MFITDYEQMSRPSWLLLSYFFCCPEHVHQCVLDVQLCDHCFFRFFGYPKHVHQHILDVQFLDHQFFEYADNNLDF